jgi:L-threonylcarbamoyladenylate synthase
VIVEDSQEARGRAAAIVRRGGVIAFRTDTFYGLGADPLNREAVRAIRKLKGREEAKPILILIADVGQADQFIAERSKLFNRVCELHWPGPLTLVGRARSELPEELTAGTGTIGVRLPDDRAVRELVRHCGGALTATSANPSGKSPARTAQEVESYFPTGVGSIIDGGEVDTTEPSTVLDLSGAVPRIIREGAITADVLKDILAGSTS